jgi:hypothetical protein
MNRIVVAALALALVVGAGAFWIYSGGGSLLAEAEPRFQVSPVALTFDTVPVFDRSSNSVIVTNMSDDVLVIDGLAVDAPFRTRTGRIALQPGESQQLPVSFAPEKAGPVTGSFRVSAGDEEQVVSLAAEATGLPSIEVDPPALDFGEVGLGTGATAMVTVRNKGKGELVISRLRTTGSFEFDTNAPPIPPGAEHHIEIAFHPRRLGEERARLTIDSNDPDISQEIVSLMGVAVEGDPAPAISIEPAFLDFGPVRLGGTEKASIAIRNGGPDPLMLTSVTLRAPFSASTRSRQIPPGKTLKFPVSCSPKEAGQLSQQMIIHSNDPESGLMRVDLSCRGAEEGDAELIAKEERKRRALIAGGGSDAARDGREGTGDSDSDYADCVGDDCFDDVLYGPDGEPLYPNADEKNLDPNHPEPEKDDEEELANCAWESQSEWVPCGFGSYSCNPSVEITQPPASGGPPQTVCVDPQVVHMAMGEYAEFERVCVELSFDELGEASAQVALTAHDSYGGVSTIKGTLTTGTARVAVGGTLFTDTGVPFSGDSGALVFVGGPEGVSTFGKALMIRLPMTASGCE